MFFSKNDFRRTKYSCYFANVAMSAAFCLPALLFVTFREMYNISYTLLGTLVLINFCTQLTIDLIFTIFTKYFNVKKCLRLMPLLTMAGLLVYAFIPTLFPQYAYAGLALGTVIFSVSAGLCEVLVSPVVAALPSDNPERDMSMLHSLYAYGVVMVVGISTFALKIFGTDNWMWLTAFWAILPLISFFMFVNSPMPDVAVSHKEASNKTNKSKYGLMLCVICIFLGGASEVTMTNWISGYMENALHISKVVGDILGMALFAIFLGIGRTMYAKYGKNISNVLLAGMAGALVCYLVAGFCPNNVICLIACALTGFCTSMLWPGTLILMEEKFPNCGVTAYALMASGGDFGASVSPQAMGVVVDKVAESGWATEFGTTVSMSAEQIGMRAGMVVSAVFPLLGVLLLIYMKRYFKKNKGM